jgi:hypothetical protein
MEFQTRVMETKDILMGIVMICPVYSRLSAKRELGSKKELSNPRELR